MKMFKRIKTVKGLLAGALCLLLAGWGILGAGERSSLPRWQVVGQGGGGVITDVVVHPANPDIVWVETDLTGIFKSTDGGKSFRRMSGPVERRELLFEWMRGMDHELVYDPTDPDIMYWAMDGGIYTVPGLYKSTDGGESWFKIPDSPDLAPAAVVVDHKGIIYGIKHKTMWVSEDGGKNWRQKADVPTYFTDAYDWRRRNRIFIYTTMANRIIIGDRHEDTGIYFSDDKGGHWRQALKGREIMDVAVSPVDPLLVMALEQDGTIFRSADGGASFEEVAELTSSYYTWGKWPPFYGGIAINRQNHVMAIGRWEMGVSRDGGKTFTVYDEETPAWDPAGYIFSARQSWRGLFKSNKLVASPAPGKWFSVDGHMLKEINDDGLRWTGRYRGIDILCLYSPPVIDRRNPDIIHVAAGDNGHFYSVNGGKSWKSSETKMVNVDGLAQDPNNPDIWYKLYGRRPMEAGKVYKSTDGGVTWEYAGRIPMPGFGDWSESDPSFYRGWCGWLVVDPTDSRRIFVTHRASDGLYMSEDGGRNFRRVLALDKPWQLVVTDSGNIFICTWDSRGLYRSRDGGKTFDVIHEGMVNDFAVHPRNDDIVFINVDSFRHAWATARVKPKYEQNRVYEDRGKGRLYKTSDGGDHWELLGAYDGFALYIEPNFPDVMLMSTRDGGQGIMRSADGGKSWVSIHGNHNNYHPRGFIYGGVPGRVYTWNHNMERMDNIHLDSLFTRRATIKTHRHPGE